MKTTLKYFAAMSAIILLSSCEKNPSFNHNHDESLRIRNVRTLATESKSSGSEAIISSQSIESYDGEISLSGVVAPMGTYYATKATEATIDDLKCNDAFVLKGYLGDEITTAEGADPADCTNRNFMNTSASYDNGDNCWYTDGEFKWRNLITHHFWAYRGTPSSFQVNSDFSRASFSYYSSGSEDLLVAYSSKFYKEGTTDDSLDGISFQHALSAVSFMDDVSYKVRKVNVVGGEVTDAPAERCKIGKAFFLAKRNGSCTTTSDGTFTWTTTADTTGQIHYLETPVNANSLEFVIPQNIYNSAAVISFTDTQRELTFPFVYPFKKSSITEWNAGEKLTYKVDGTVYVPYVEGPSGINANFAGKGFQSLGVLNNVNMEYIKTIRVTWCGLPQTTGNGTYSWISYQDHDPVASEYPEDATALNNLSHANIGFGYNHKTNTLLKGQYLGTEVIDGVTYPKYQAIMDLTGVNTPQNIYLVFLGGSNGGGSEHDGCQWRVRNMVIEVLELKNLSL